MPTETHNPECDRGTIVPSTVDDDYECVTCGYQVGINAVFVERPDTWRGYVVYCCEECTP